MVVKVSQSTVGRAGEAKEHQKRRLCRPLDVGPSKILRMLDAPSFVNPTSEVGRTPIDLTGNRLFISNPSEVDEGTRKDLIELLLMGLPKIIFCCLLHVVLGIEFVISTGRE